MISQVAFKSRKNRIVGLSKLLMVSSALLLTLTTANPSSSFAQGVQAGSWIDLAPFFDSDTPTVVSVRNAQGIQFPLDTDDVRKIFYKDSVTGEIQPVNGEKRPGGYTRFQMDFSALGSAVSDSSSVVIRAGGESGSPSTPMQVVIQGAGQTPTQGNFVLDYNSLMNEFNRLGSRNLNGNLNGQQIQFILNPDGSIRSSNGFIFYPDGRVVNAQGQPSQFQIQYNSPGVNAGNLSTSDRIQMILNSGLGVNGSIQNQGSNGVAFQGGALPNANGTGTLEFGVNPGSAGSGGAIVATTPQPGANGYIAQQEFIPSGVFQFELSASDLPGALVQIHQQIDTFSFSQRPEENLKLKLQTMQYFSSRLGYYKFDESDIESPDMDRIKAEDSKYSLQVDQNDYIHIVKIEVPGPRDSNDEWVMVRRVYHSQNEDDFSLRLVTKEEHLAAIALANERGQNEFLKMAANKRLAKKDGNRYVATYDSADYENAKKQADWVSIQGGWQNLVAGRIGYMPGGQTGIVSGNNMYSGFQVIYTGQQNQNPGGFDWSTGTNPAAASSGRWTFSAAPTNPGQAGNTSGQWGVVGAPSGNQNQGSGAGWTFTNAPQAGAQFGTPGQIIIHGANNNPLANHGGIIFQNGMQAPQGLLANGLVINGQQLDPNSANSLLSIYFAATGTTPDQFNQAAFQAWLQQNAVPQLGSNGQMIIQIRGASIDPQTGNLVISSGSQIPAQAQGQMTRVGGSAGAQATPAVVETQIGTGYRITDNGDGTYKLVTFEVRKGSFGRLELKHKVRFVSEAELAEYRDANGNLILSADNFGGQIVDRSASGAASGSDSSVVVPAESSTARKIEEILASLNPSVYTMGVRYDDENGVHQYQAEIRHGAIPLDKVKNFLESEGVGYHIRDVRRYGQPR